MAESSYKVNLILYILQCWIFYEMRWFSSKKTAHLIMIVNLFISNIKLNEELVKTKFSSRYSLQPLRSIWFDE